MQNTPLITIGIVTLNRAWIISEVLDSIASQTYPHDKLFILLVDGNSKDGTPNIAEHKLKNADYSGYKVIVQKCNIPEGRNICLQKMQGELLLFWDSDVIMLPNAVAKLVEALQTEQADIMSAVAKSVTVASTSEIAAKLQELAHPKRHEAPFEIKAVMMGQTLLSKKLATTLSFDPQLTIQEDTDFCLRARAQGFKIMLNPNVTVLDVNTYTTAYSDICIDMSLKDAMRGIRKKSQVQVYAYNISDSPKIALNFFLLYKRYLFYLFYIPAIMLTIIGILVWNLYLSLVFPIYALVYTLLQIRRRGFKRGLRAFIISLFVGIPNAVWVTYYWLKYVLKGAGKP
ncbi:MAG: glycosyltransferase [Candidatus Bathyarchaeota archaeon]|nr:glycosyltransferase [Candidatus Bathyarchaeota archaeon]